MKTRVDVTRFFPFQEQVEKCEQNIEDHEGYINKFKDCSEWIKSQESELGDCTDTPRDNEALEEKLETIKVQYRNGSKILNTDYGRCSKILNTFRSPDKSAYQKIIFSYFSTKTFVVGTQNNRLDKTVLLRTQNICLN